MNCSTPARIGFFDSGRGAVVSLTQSLVKNSFTCPAMIFISRCLASTVAHCNVRCDEQFTLILDSEEWAVLSHRFCAKDIQTGGPDLPVIQGVGEICLADDGTSSQIQQDRFVFHSAECFCVHDAFCIFIQRRVDGENVRFPEKRIEIHLMITFLLGSPGCRIVDHFCTEQTGDIRNSPADCSKSQDSPGHTVQLVECLPEMSENAVVDVPALFDIVVIISQILHQVEQDGKGMLCHRLCGVARDIAPFNPAFCEIVFVKVVCAGSSYADELQIPGRANSVFIDQNLIYDQYVSVSGAFRNFF